MKNYLKILPNLLTPLQHKQLLNFAVSRSTDLSASTYIFIDFYKKICYNIYRK